MSYTYLQEQGAESSAASFADIPQFVLSRLNLTAEKSYSNANETASCQNFPSGTMCEHSTANLGAEKSMSSAEGFPAKTYHALEKERESTENEAECGLSLQESFARLDLNTYTWKTHQQSLFEDLEESLATFPDWGSMQNGELFQRKMLEVPRSAKDFGRMRHSIQEQRQSKQIMDGSANGAIKKLCLDANVTTESGNAMNVVNGHTHFIMMNGTVALTVAPKMWPTPQANEDAAGTPEGKMQRMLGNHPLIRGTTLEQWKSGTLNPTWVEWLMGWPLEWTDLKPLGMDKFQQWLHSHGIL
jgi:hypothetical protein